MSSLIIQLPLGYDAVTLHTDGMTVELGNGVRLTTDVPKWVLQVYHAKLQLVLDVEGSPPDASTEHEND